MVDESLALLTAHPEWAPVLDAYRAREIAASQQQVVSSAAKAAPAGEQANAEGAAESDAGETGDEDSLVGWVDRIREVPGVDTAALSGIHGRLIAFGLLKCDLGNRSAGLVYRLSSQGKSALKGFAAAQQVPASESA